MVGRKVKREQDEEGDKQGKVAKGGEGNRTMTRERFFCCKPETPLLSKIK
jgi:hypothetical protein